MDVLMLLLAAAVALAVGLGVASVTMNATLRLVHHISRASAAQASSAVGQLLP